MSTPATDETSRLQDYVRRTQGPLDLFALLTIWLAVLPFAALPSHDNKWVIWVVGRSALSVVFGIDLALRMRYSGTPIRYAVRHPVNVLAVLFPPVRIIFSLRLLTAMFRRGNLAQFLFTAAMLLANGAVIVYAFESHATGANIRTIGEALWWAVVTVATVGYGDYYPVTVGGRLTAAALMALGVVILAVVTAQVASNFSDQAARSRAASPVPDGAPATVADDVMTRLERIESLLVDATIQPGAGEE